MVNSPILLFIFRVPDLWHQKPARNAQITWETRVRPVYGIDESRKPNSYEVPWLGTREDNDVLMVGGLRVREEWIGEFRCLANSPISNASAESEWVRLEVLSGDTRKCLTVHCIHLFVSFFYC